MKVYITKYALVKGIIEREVSVVDEYPNMITSGTQVYREYYHKPHWHETKEEAIFQANKMKQRKLESLHKSIKKIEALEFK